MIIDLDKLLLDPVEGTCVKCHSTEQVNILTDVCIRKSKCLDNQMMNLVLCKSCNINISCKFDNVCLECFCQSLKKTMGACGLCNTEGLIWSNERICVSPRNCNFQLRSKLSIDLSRREDPRCPNCNCFLTRKWGLWCQGCGKIGITDEDLTD